MAMILPDIEFQLCRRDNRLVFFWGLLSFLMASRGWQKPRKCACLSVDFLTSGSFETLLAAFLLLLAELGPR